MQTVLRLALLLFLAHLLTDFVFQNSRLVEQKRSGQAAGYAKHGAIHYVFAVLLGGFFVPGMLFSLRFQIALLGLTAVHLLIDFGKIRLAQAQVTGESTLPFVIDQLLHFATIGIAAWLIVGTVPLSDLLASVNALRGARDRVLLAAAVYVAALFAGGYLIRSMTRPLMAHVRTRESHTELIHAGMYIGWLERFLVLTALLLHSPATVGLIVAAKSIARYPEFKNEQFAEYFLIGTLLSISIAILGGLILQKVLYGHYMLPA
jgi:hypothetical protein